MNSEHFSYFRVKNFKRFRDLEVKDIGQFNLVLGDNNVGKTSLLEALIFPREGYHFPSFRTPLKWLIKAFKNRNLQPSEDSFYNYLKSVDNEFLSAEFSTDDESTLTLSSEPFFSEFKELFLEKLHRDNFSEDDTLKWNAKQMKGRIELGHSKRLDSDQYINLDIEKSDSEISPFIPFQRSYEEELALIYLNNIQPNKNQKQLFIKSLQFVFEEIENVELSLRGIERTLIINKTGSDFSIPIAYYGEGTIKIVKILAFIIAFRDHKIFIDEIDAGIYHSRMKDYWKVILQSAQENNVQLFATTHNRECIEAYQRALEELGVEYQDKARTIRLVEHAQTKDIIAFTNSYEKMTEELLTGNEVR